MCETRIFSWFLNVGGFLTIFHWVYMTNRTSQQVLVTGFTVLDVSSTVIPGLLYLPSLRSSFLSSTSAHVQCYFRTHLISTHRREANGICLNLFPSELFLPANWPNWPNHSDGESFFLLLQMFCNFFSLLLYIIYQIDKYVVSWFVSNFFLISTKWPIDIKYGFFILDSFFTHKDLNKANSYYVCLYLHAFLIEMAEI